MIDEISLEVAHQPQTELGAEDAGVLGLVFLQDVGLHGTAYGLQRPGLHLFIYFPGQHFIAGQAQQQQTEPVVAFRQRFGVVPGPGQSAIVVFGFQAGFHPVFEPVFADVFFALLINGGVHEKGGHRRCRPVDGHRYRRFRIAEVEP